MDRYYITTTLPYVNAEPHIGFALEIVQADMLARYYRQQGAEVVFNTGTDEHGQKIYKKAVEAGISPQAYCDQYAAKFDDLKQLLNLTYTNFIRTTDAHHVAAAQKFWQLCDAQGDIYKRQYQTKYCVGCELEKTDSELVDGRCPIHPKLDIELRDEENYFFRWSKYQQKLLDHYAQNPEFVLPPHRLNEITKFVEGGLNDFSISRVKDKMPWGVPVPGDDTQVMYVWFDALVNYISTLNWPDGGDFKNFWPGVQVAGVDNLRQQSAMWQAMLLSAGLPMSKQIFIHGFFTVEGQKMSKSLGNTIHPKDLVAEYGVDAVRYFLLREMPYGADGDFSKVRMEERYLELADGLGNLVGRVAAMANKYFDGQLNDDTLEPTAEDQKLLALLRDQSGLTEAINRYDFKDYLDQIWNVVMLANGKIQKDEPFKLVKTDPAAAKKSLWVVTQMIVGIAQALTPVIPNAAEEILKRYTGAKLIHGEPLFPKQS
jgi:methionyl-tRNA synthetase